MLARSPNSPDPNPSQDVWKTSPITEAQPYNPRNPMSPFPLESHVHAPTGQSSVGTMRGDLHNIRQVDLMWWMMNVCTGDWVMWSPLHSCWFQFIHVTCSAAVIIMNVTVHFHHALYPASYIHLFINLAVWNDSEHHEGNRCSQWISDALCKDIKLQLVVRLVGSRGKFRFKHHTHNPLYWLILLTCWKTCYICIHNSSPPHCKALECCCTFKEEKLTHLETLQLDT